MTKKLLLLLGFLTLSLSAYVFAADTPSWCDPTSKDAVTYLKACAQGTNGLDPNGIDAKSSGGVTGIKDLVIKIAERVLQFAALFAVGAIVWSGIKYTTAYGDDEKVKSAKSTAIYAIIWLVLTLTAFSLVDILINFIYSLRT